MTDLSDKIMIVVSLVICGAIMYAIMALIDKKMSKKEGYDAPRDPMYESDCDKASSVHPYGLQSNELIGVIYPPELGPIKRGVGPLIPCTDQVPCASPFAGIYKDKVIYYSGQPSL